MLDIAKCFPRVFCILFFFFTLPHPTPFKALLKDIEWWVNKYELNNLSEDGEEKDL